MRFVRNIILFSRVSMHCERPQMTRMMNSFVDAVYNRWNDFARNEESHKGERREQGKSDYFRYSNPRLEGLKNSKRRVCAINMSE